MTHETLDTIIVSAILLCSLYECWILTAEYRYDEAKDLAKEKRTKTRKKTTQMPGGKTVTEENTETVEESK